MKPPRQWIVAGLLVLVLHFSSILVAGGTITGKVDEKVRYSDLIDGKQSRHANTKLLHMYMFVVNSISTVSIHCCVLSSTTLVLV